jgi:hypothetical protein
MILEDLNIPMKWENGMKLDNTDHGTIGELEYREIVLRKLPITLLQDGKHIVNNFGSELLLDARPLICLLKTSVFRSLPYLLKMLPITV